MEIYKDIENYNEENRKLVVNAIREENRKDGKDESNHNTVECR